MAEKKSFKTISENRQARHAYFVEESYEAGIELAGTEVKALRAHGANLKDAWCDIENGDLLRVRRSEHHTLMADMGLRSFYETAYEKLR